MRAFGPYVVEAELGRGAAGVVYRARGPGGEVVALKVLVVHRAHEVQVRRMEREVRVLERLRHPALVAVRATGQTSSGPWIAMDLIDGETLDARLAREGPMPPREAAAMAAEVARAVAHAHEHGVLHRDVKPANVLLDRAGRPFLTDFGLAKDLDGSLHGASLSATGQFLGTPGYWPPEQAAGDRGAVGPASDVYGLGATLFAMLTGRPPVVAATLVEALEAVKDGIPPPSRLNPDVPAGLDAVVARATRLAPAARYASAAELAAALDGWVSAQRGRAGRRGPAGRRTPVVVAALALGALALGLVVVAVASRRDPPDAPPPAASNSTAVEPSAPRQPPSPPSPAEVSPEQVITGRLHELLVSELDAMRRDGDQEALLSALRQLPRTLPADVMATPRGVAWRAEALVLAAREDGDLTRIERALELLEGLDVPEARLVRAAALSASARQPAAVAEVVAVLSVDDPALRARALDAAARLSRTFPECQRVLMHHDAVLARWRIEPALTLLEHLARAAPAGSEQRLVALCALARAERASDPDARDAAARARLAARVEAARVEAPSDPRPHLLRAELALAWEDVAGAREALRDSARFRAKTPPEVAQQAVALAGLEEALTARAAGDAARALVLLDALRAHGGPGVWGATFRVVVAERRSLVRRGLEPTTLTPDLRERIADRADALLAAERLAEARALLEDAPPRGPDAPSNPLARQVAALHLLEAEAARRAADEGLRVHHLLLAVTGIDAGPDLRARAETALGRHGEAMAHFVAALVAGQVDAALARDAVEASRRAYPETRRSFLAAVPGTPRAVERLAAVAQRVDDPPLRAAAFLALARAAHAAGDEEAAGEALDRAVALDPGPGARVARAEWRLARRDLFEAEADLAASRSAVMASPDLLMPRAGQLGRLLSALRLDDPAARAAELDAIAATPVDDDDRWTLDLVEHVRALRQ